MWPTVILKPAGVARPLAPTGSARNSGETAARVVLAVIAIIVFALVRIGMDSSRSDSRPKPYEYRPDPYKYQPDAFKWDPPVVPGTKTETWESKLRRPREDAPKEAKSREAGTTDRSRRNGTP